MKTSFTQRILAVAVIVLLNVTNSFAHTGLIKFATKAPMEIRQINKNTVEITNNLISVNGEYYELEKSTDNKNFKTVTIIFPFDNTDNINTPVVLKDKVTTATTYYRLKCINNNSITYTQLKGITLAK